MKTKLSAMNLQQGLRNKYQPSWHWAILGILLISLLPAGEGSLVVKMQKRETYRVFQNGDTDTLPIATDLVSGPSHLISKRDTQESNATVSTKVKGHAVSEKNISSTAFQCQRSWSWFILFSNQRRMCCVWVVYNDNESFLFYCVINSLLILLTKQYSSLNQS